MTELAPRTLIGRDLQVSRLHRVYRRGDSIEIDESDHTQITRRRIFFADVEQVTLHKEKRVLVPIVLGLLVGIPSLLFVSLGGALSPAVRIGGWLAFALALVGSVAAAVFIPRWVVTIRGGGVRARASLGMGEVRAREDLGTLLTAIADAQRREWAAQAPRASRVEGAPRESQGAEDNSAGSQGAEIPSAPVTPV